MNLPLLKLDEISKIMDKGSQLLHLLRIRIVMGSVEEGQGLPEVILRHGLIGCQHEILYDFCGSIALIRFDLQGLSLGIQDNLALRKVKVNGSPFLPLFPEYVRYLFHQHEHGHKPLILSHDSFVPVRDNGIHRRVCHSTVHMNHCLRDFVTQHVSLGIQFHDAA